MTPQEQQLIDGLVERVRSTPATDKDNDADAYLHRHLDTVPDALYVLAQTVLVQQFGLNNAKQQLDQTQQQLDDAQQQIADLQAQLSQQPKKQGSFLSHLLGTDQSAPPQNAPQSQYQPVNTGYAAPPPPPYGAPMYAQPVYAQPMYGGGGGGFLRGALQTAAGVAAGEMFFQGMENLFHGFGGGGYGYEGGRPTEIINNNYYDDAPREGHEHHESGSSDDSGFYDPSNDASRQGLSSDIEDRRNDFADTNNDDSDTSGYDDAGSNFEDSGSDDDSGSYDDGGDMSGGDSGGF